MILLEIAQDPDSLNQVIQGMQAQIDSLGQIVQSSMPVTDSQILGEVRDYYEDSWSDLKWTIGIVLTTLAVIIPILTTIIQKWNFKIEKKHIAQDVHNMVINGIDEKAEERLEEFSDRLNQNHGAMEANFGLVLYDLKMYQQSIFALRRAINSYLKALDFKDVSSILPHMQKSLQEVDFETFEKATRVIGQKPLDELLKLIQETDKEGITTINLAQLKLEWERVSQKGTK